MQLVETVIGRAADKQGVQVCALVAGTHGWHLPGRVANNT